MKDLIIIGAGDTGREMIDLLERINSVEPEWNLLGFVDDKEFEPETLIDGYPVIGKVDWLNTADKTVYAVCTVGNGKIKKKIISGISNPNVRFATLIDPTAQLHKGTVCGEGCIIYANAIASINVKIGNHVYLGYSSTIGHDTQLGDCSSVYPGCNVSGKVVIGESCELGTGCKIIQGKTVGNNVILGAGAVVVKDIPADCTAVGCPAEPIR